MKVSYKLAHPEYITSSMILLTCSWKGLRLRTSSGASINPKFWDSAKGKVKTSSSESTHINAKLDKLKSYIIEQYNTKNINNESISIDKLKKTIQDFLNPPQIIKVIIDEKKSFIDLLNDYIEDRIKGIVLDSSGYALKKESAKHYFTTVNHLKEFEKLSGYDLNYNSINEVFYSKFNSYLLNYGLNNNTIGKYFKPIKTFMLYTLKQKKHDNTNFKDEIKVIKEDSDLLALSIEELRKIENCFPENPKLQKVKDHFLLLCYSGLRYSDLKQLKPENINIKEGYIKVNTIKTSDNIEVALNNKAIEILTKYPKLDLKVISNQKFNDSLKELCELSGINEPIQKTTYSGKQRNDNTLPKCEMITSHCGRRTYITLSLKLGILPEMVMKTTGHKKRDTFQKYVKVSQKESVDAVKSVWNKM